MPIKALDPGDFPEIMNSGRSEVSYQICKEFLASGLKLAQVDNNDFPKHKPTAISSSLNAYIRRHELPMKNTIRETTIYIYRTDISEEGTVETKDIDDYVKQAFALPVGKASTELINRKDIPTLSVSTARERLAEENVDPE